MVAYALEPRMQTRMDECSRIRFIRDTSSYESIHLKLKEKKIMKEAGKKWKFRPEKSLVRFYAGASKRAAIVLKKYSELIESFIFICNTWIKYIF